MSVSIIPFKVFEAAEIPGAVTARMAELGPEQGVEYVLELMLQIDAASTIAFQRVDAAGTMEVSVVAGERRQELGDALAAAGKISPGQRAVERRSALLIMGTAEESDSELPEDLVRFVCGGQDTGNVGYIYALPLESPGELPLGAMTLLRPAAAGPLNHDQPGIVEAVRQELGALLSA
jgi:hypothetical protein